jgi:LEA14-like dessication related protein
MRNKGKWKIVVIVAVLVTIGSCAAMTGSVGVGLADYPEIKGPHHHIEWIGHNSTLIQSTAMLSNPNIFPIKFKKVEYSIFLNDILIGNGHSEENVLILPRSEKKLAVQSEIYQKQILKWLKERIKIRKNTTVNIKGDITFDLGIFDYKYPINISITESEIWKKHFNNSFSFAYPVTDLNGDKISEMIIDVWNFEDSYISGEVRVVDGKDGSLLWNRSLGVGIPVAYPATDLNGDNVTDFIVNVWDINRNWATQILVLNGVNGSELWEWVDEDGLAAAYPCTDFNGDKITEIVVNSYSFIEEEKSTNASMGQASMTVSATNRTLSATFDTTGAYTLRVTDNSPPNVGDTETVDCYIKEETPFVRLNPSEDVGIGEPLVVTGISNREEEYTIIVTVKGPTELTPQTVKVENGTFEATFDTTDAEVGTYIVKADDGDGLTDETTVEILTAAPTPTPEETPLKLTDMYADYGIDTDGDGKYDYLAVDVWVSVSEAGSYYLQGWLRDSVWRYVAGSSDTRHLNKGLQAFTLKFNGYDIYRNGDRGSFTFDFTLYDEDWNMINHEDNAYTAPYYSYTDFDGPPIDITDAYADYGIDTDGNEKYDYLAIDVGVDVKEAGTYEVYGGLHDNEGHFVTSDEHEVNLSIGLQKFTLNFDGYRIYRNGIDGPFSLRHVELYDEWNRVDYKYGAYVTSYYNHTEFDRKFTGNFIDYGFDTDDDTLYDYLILEAEINVTKAGKYELGGDLQYYDEEEGYLEDIDDDWNETYLEVGIHNITLQFDGIRIYNSKYSGSFRVWLRLYETEEGNWIDEMEYFTNDYDYTDFQRPPAEFAPGFNDYGLDTDDNSLYNYLVIEKEIKVREAGNYRLSGSLVSQSGEWIDSDSNYTYLNVGLHSIKLQFYGPSIYNAGESGRFNVFMYLYEMDDLRELGSIINTTSYYTHTDFERPTAEFTGNFFDYGLDVGEDGLYNYLVVESEINVTKAGEYRLSGILRYYDEEDCYWVYVDGDGNRTHLKAGIQNITLRFDGYQIYNSKYNGSFKVESQLYDTEGKIHDVEYLTSYYNYTDFNPSPPVEIPVTEIYVFDGSNGAQLWNISIRNCLAAAYPISDIDGDNLSELLVNKWIIEDDEVSFTKIEIVKGIDASELWNKSFANCFAATYPVTDLNGDNITELVVNAWRFDRPESVTEIFVLEGKDGSLLWNRSVTEGHIAAAYPVTDFTGDNITEIAINAINLDSPSTIVEIADGVDGTSLWSKTINNSLSAIYPATDLTKDGTSELIINSWLFSDGFLSKSEVFIVNGLGGGILWNLSTTEGLTATYPATDLTNNNVSEIIINSSLRA